MGPPPPSRLPVRTCPPACVCPQACPRAISSPGPAAQRARFVTFSQAASEHELKFLWSTTPSRIAPPPTPSPYPSTHEITPPAPHAWPSPWPTSAGALTHPFEFAGREQPGNKQATKSKGGVLKQEQARAHPLPPFPLVCAAGSPCKLARHLPPPPSSTVVTHFHPWVCRQQTSTTEHGQGGDSEQEQERAGPFPPFRGVAPQAGNGMHARTLLGMCTQIGCVVGYLDDRIGSNLKSPWGQRP